MKLPARALPVALGATLALLVAGTSRPAEAQIESALLSKVTLNLANPGGKSLAMGGAFTAIADDSTAALANPAGLGLLSSVEVGVSGKRVDDVIGLVTARSTATGSLTAAYPDPKAVNSDLGSTRSALDFGAVVIPVSRRIVAAVTYAENIDFRGDPGSDGYSYIELRDNRSGGITRRDFLYEYREFGAVSLKNKLVGASFAYRVTERLRVGAGVTVNKMDLALDGDAGGAHRIVNRTFLTPTNVETRTVTMAVRDFGGTVAGFVVGFHADLLPGGTLTAGGAYRQTGKTSGTFVLGGDVPTALAGQTERSFSMSVPRDAALGLAAKPFPGLTIAAEAQWIAYSDLASRSLPVVSYAGFAGPPPGFPVDGVLATLEPPRNVVLPRIGLEYVAATDKLVLAFRMGYHREPARGVKADLAVTDTSGNRYDISDPPFSSSVRTVYDGGKPDDRFSAGFGATISQKVSLDFSFDLGRSSRILAASLFYKF